GEGRVERRPLGAVPVDDPVAGGDLLVGGRQLGGRGQQLVEHVGVGAEQDVGVAALPLGEGERVDDRRDVVGGGQHDAGVVAEPRPQPVLDRRPQRRRVVVGGEQQVAGGQHGA